MIERTKERFDLYPARLAGDSAYGSAEMLRLAGLRARHRAACDGVRQVGAQGWHLLARGLHLRSAGDVYLCPGGKMLTTTGTRGE